MYTILKKEFFSSFKSIRAILIVLFITIISYQSALFFSGDNPLTVLLLEEGAVENEIYTVVIALIIMIFGFLFVFAISHDVVNKELELKTIRLLVTKVSRLEIVLGKMLGMFFFWLVVVSVSFLIITAISHTWQWRDYIQVLIFMFYIINFVLLISTCITSTKLTMFLGIILGLTIPIMALISLLSEKWYITTVSYLLPYAYLEGSLWKMLIPFTMGLLFCAIALFVMERRDL